MDTGQASGKAVPGLLELVCVVPCRCECRQARSFALFGPISLHRTDDGETQIEELLLPPKDVRLVSPFEGSRTGERPDGGKEG